jgi:hypothetical protein
MADVKKIIQDIKDKDLSGSNEQQGAFAEMIKGLAFSDDPLSNEFMKKVDKAITKIADETLKKEEGVEQEVITIEEDVTIGNVILEKGDKIRILENSYKTQIIGNESDLDKADEALSAYSGDPDWEWVSDDTVSFSNEDFANEGDGILADMGLKIKEV